MESTTNKVHFCKLQLQNAIENLAKLERVQGNALNLEASEVVNLITNTQEILTKLEKQPTDKIKQILQKRKRKRQRAKLKRKLKSVKNEFPNVDALKAESLTQTLPKTYNGTTTSLKPAQKLHQQLRSYRDANRFLKTFELLELLHAARSQDEAASREFASQLSKLRTVWNVIRSENKPGFTVAQNVEDQWNYVLFGTKEKSFYKQKRSVLELINIRRKWDTYITSDAKIGSTIPDCWVLPPENANELWQQFRSQ